MLEHHYSPGSSYLLNKFCLREMAKSIVSCHGRLYSSLRHKCSRPPFSFEGSVYVSIYIHVDANWITDWYRLTSSSCNSNKCLCFWSASPRPRLFHSEFCLAELSWLLLLLLYTSLTTKGSVLLWKWCLGISTTLFTIYLLNVLDQFTMFTVMFILMECASAATFKYFDSLTSENYINLAINLNFEQIPGNQASW